MKLGDAATIRTGLVLSRKEARGLPGVRYPLLNLRSVNPKGYIDLEQVGVYDSKERLAPEYLSQIGDIIVRLSIPYTAVVINDVTAGMVISSNFAIIRVDCKKLIPEYLSWLINTAETKKAIYGKTGSNMIGAIKASFFSEFEVTLLPLDDQRKIADMNRIAIEESNLLHQLADERGKYYSLIIKNVYKEMRG